MTNFTREVEIFSLCSIRVYGDYPLFATVIQYKFVHVRWYNVILENSNSVMFLVHRGEVDEQVWRFLLTGGVALENPHPNPFPHWLSEKSWGEVVRASELPNNKDWFKSMHMYIHSFCTL